MNGQDRVTIRKLPTGVPGLDEILGGGLPEFSFNIISGSPGGGKTTLAHQVMFANATPERPALYFTVPGEPAIKMLRYQQQFTFFDLTKLNTSIRFVNLSQVVLNQDLNAVLEEIVKEVEAANPSLVVVDSFRTVVRKAQSGASDLELQGFIQRLALHLTSRQATTFLIGEYDDEEIRDNPVFTVADGLFWLSQQVERNSIVRKLQIRKSRGQASVPGLHTFRITDAGLQAFPRTFGLTGREERPKGNRRLSVGIPELDEMLGGDIPEGDSLLVAGSSGTGKSLFILRMRFVSINGQLRKMMVVIKMRRSTHSIDMREFEITSKRLVIGERLTGYRGLTTGVPGPWNDGQKEFPGEPLRGAGENGKLGRRRAGSGS